LPIDLEFAEIVPTWRSLGSLQGSGDFLQILDAMMTALSMPRLTSIGLRPEATAFRPPDNCLGENGGVVVPSPAHRSIDATSFTICAPMFSNLSLSSISFATKHILCDVGREALLEHRVTALGAERRLDGVG